MTRTRNTEPRNQQLNLSLTASELAMIRQRAQAVGMRPAHFGRAMLLDRKQATLEHGQAVDSNIGRIVHAQLVRLGNNLNQLIRHLHRTGDPLPPDLEPLLADIRQIIARVPQ